MREDRHPALEVPDELPRRANVLIAVVAADAVLADGLLQSLDRAPVELDARRHDEEVVGYLRPARGQHRALVGAELCDGVLEPYRALRDDGGFCVLGRLPVRGPAALVKG